MTVGSPQPLSFRPERSGVEKSHSEMGQAALWWEISRLRVSIEYKTFTLIPACSPARNDSRDAVPAPFCFFLKCLYAARRPCHFDRSEAKWRNPTPEWYSPWRQEISRLRVLIEPKTFTLIPACRPARNDSSRDAAPAPFCFFLKCLYTGHRPCHFDRSRSAANRKASYWAG